MQQSEDRGRQYCQPQPQLDESWRTESEDEEFIRNVGVKNAAFVWINKGKVLLTGMPLSEF